MTDNSQPNVHQQWANFRFAVVSSLMVSPPAKGTLRVELKKLAKREWVHPITSKPVCFGFSTIERWYHQAKKSPNPVVILRKKIRKDMGKQKILNQTFIQTVINQYRQHPGWTFQLHYDNLATMVQQDSKLEPLPSYQTVRRFMQSKGLLRRSFASKPNTEGSRKASERLEQREVRSYESSHVNALWHLDFHHARRSILTTKGDWVKPIIMAIIDDRSRLICHAQWYFHESAENLIHCLIQAFQKRDLPRALMSDNGAPMIASETRQGLERLSVHHETTLPYSPYQNGKQESFWGQIEGRLMAMLEGVSELDLNTLNNATQAWVEMEYNRKVHSETKKPPINIFIEDPNVGRSCPDGDVLRQAFTIEEIRTQRRSDGTITVKGVRFELPSRLLHLQRVTVRYARWDLSCVHLADPKNGVLICRLLPQNKENNADGKRRMRSSKPDDTIIIQPNSSQDIAPLLKKQMAEYAATGAPPAYLHHNEEK